MKIALEDVQTALFLSEMDFIGKTDSLLESHSDSGFRSRAWGFFTNFAPSPEKLREDEIEKVKERLLRTAGVFYLPIAPVWVAMNRRLPMVTTGKLLEKRNPPPREDFADEYIGRVKKWNSRWADLVKFFAAKLKVTKIELVIVCTLAQTFIDALPERIEHYEEADGSDNLDSAISDILGPQF